MPEPTHPVEGEYIYIDKTSQEEPFCFHNSKEVMLCVAFYKSVLKFEGASDSALNSLDKLVQVAYSFGARAGKNQL